MSGLGLPFKIFVLVGLVAALRQRGRDRPTTMLHAFLTVALVGSFAPIVTQRDNWPFSAWPLVAAAAPQVVTHQRLVALGASGEEYEIDFRAYRPLDFGELHSWLRWAFEQLPPGQREAAFAYLLDRIENARRRSLDGRLGELGWLGPLGAPSFVFHPRRWTGPEGTPRERFVGLRLYRESWSPEARARGAAVTRELTFEHRAQEAGR